MYEREKKKKGACACVRLSMYMYMLCSYKNMSNNKNYIRIEEKKMSELFFFSFLHRRLDRVEE